MAFITEVLFQLRSLNLGALYKTMQEDNSFLSTIEVPLHLK